MQLLRVGDLSDYPRWTSREKCEPVTALETTRAFLRSAPIQASLGVALVAAVASIIAVPAHELGHLASLKAYGQAANLHYAWTDRGLLADPLSRSATLVCMLSGVLLTAAYIVVAYIFTLKGKWPEIGAALFCAACNRLWKLPLFVVVYPLMGIRSPYWLVPGDEIVVASIAGLPLVALPILELLAVGLLVFQIQKAKGINPRIWAASAIGSALGLVAWLGLMGPLVLP